MCCRGYFIFFVVFFLFSWILRCENVMRLWRVGLEILCRSLLFKTIRTSSLFATDRFLSIITFITSRLEKPSSHKYVLEKTRRRLPGVAYVTVAQPGENGPPFPWAVFIVIYSTKRSKIFFQLNIDPFPL